MLQFKGMLQFNVLLHFNGMLQFNDQLKEDQLIDAIVEELMESVGAGDLVMMRNREGHDNADPRFYSSNDSEDSGDKE
eukprot:jgi/Tetstr1/448271/TSEL_035558.t1